MKKAILCTAFLGGVIAVIVSTSPASAICYNQAGEPNCNTVVKRALGVGEAVQLQVGNVSIDKSVIPPAPIALTKDDEIGGIAIGKLGYVLAKQTANNDKSTIRGMLGTKAVGFDKALFITPKIMSTKHHTPAPQGTDTRGRGVAIVQYNASIAG